LSVNVILGGRLIDGTGAEPVENSAVVIDGKTIKAAGSRGTVRVPSDAEVVDAGGRIVMPGLIESHNHPLGERDLSDPGFKKYYDNLVTSPALGLLKGVQVIQRMLTLGITTVRIPHPTIPNAPELRGEWLVALRTAVERGYFPAPRVVAGGCVLPTGGHLNALAPPSSRTRAGGAPTAHGRSGSRPANASHTRSTSSSSSAQATRGTGRARDPNTPA